MKLDIENGNELTEAWCNANIPFFFNQHGYKLLGI